MQTSEPRIFTTHSTPLSESYLKSISFDGWTSDRVGECDKCRGLDYILVPEAISGKDSKRYIICLHCGAFSHL